MDSSNYSTDPFANAYSEYMAGSSSANSSSYSSNPSDTYSTYKSAEYLAKENYGMEFVGGIGGHWTQPTKGNLSEAAELMQSIADLRVQQAYQNGRSGFDSGHLNAWNAAEESAKNIRESIRKSNLTSSGGSGGSSSYSGSSSSSFMSYSNSGENCTSAISYAYNTNSYSRSSSYQYEHINSPYFPGPYPSIGELKKNMDMTYDRYAKETDFWKKQELEKYVDSTRKTYYTVLSSGKYRD